MEVKFTLTYQQVSDIQRAARAAYDVAVKAKSEAVSVVERAERARVEAAAAYSRVSNVTTSRQYTISELETLTKGVPGAITLTPSNYVGGGVAAALAGIPSKVDAATVPQNQPVLPKQVLAYYSFPSYSKEGAGHEVVFGRDSSYLAAKTSCNCVAGIFGRECWAQRAVKRGSSVAYSPSIIHYSGRPNGRRIYAPSQGFGTKR